MGLATISWRRVMDSTSEENGSTHHDILIRYLSNGNSAQIIEKQKHGPDHILSSCFFFFRYFIDVQNSSAVFHALTYKIPKVNRHLPKHFRMRLHSIHTCVSFFVFLW